MADYIESPQNARIKATARLRDRRARKQSGMILIDGARELMRAIDGGIEVVEAFVCQDLLISADANACVVRLKNAGADIVHTSAAAYGKLRYGERDDGIVAVARRPTPGLDSLTLREDSMIAVVECVEKPGNLGAILRTADAAGVTAVIASDARGDIYGANAIRASLGAVFTVPLFEATSADAYAWLRAANVSVFVATPDAEASYTSALYTGRFAIVLGAEASGISDVWRGDACRAIGLPMHGKIDSLNVSATAAVLFYEALRQRSAASSGLP